MSHHSDNFGRLVEECQVMRSRNGSTNQRTQKQRNRETEKQRPSISVSKHFRLLQLDNRGKKVSVPLPGPIADNQDVADKLQNPVKVRVERSRVRRYSFVASSCRLCCTSQIIAGHDCETVCSVLDSKGQKDLTKAMDSRMLYYKPDDVFTEGKVRAIT